MEYKVTKGSSSFKEKVIPIFSALTIGYLLFYLYWRATGTLNPEAMAFSVILLLAEAFGVMNYVLFAWMTAKIPPVAAAHLPRKGLSVDIFVPTYNEDAEIIEATLVGCNSIKYPHTTYLLDDGRRPEIAKLAGRLGCEYIARASNEHAKAGNINAALAQTSGEFIVVLDCDMAPQPDFLDRTLPHFEDPKLAVVQLPQEFYNMDSIQHNSEDAADRWHEQSLFFRVIQPGKNRSNSAFWCGSPSVLRREALEDIGGVAVETITEDIHTSIRLHSRGWRTLFVNEPLAYGIAPQTVKSFLMQRLRWAQGTMQLYRTRESPLFIPGLTLKQRLSYLASFMAYFESFQKFILISTPSYILLTGAFPMRVGAVDFLLHWLPYFALTITANKLSGRGYFRYFQTEKFNLLKMVIFMRSTLNLIFRETLKFNVTPKSTNGSVYREERRALRSYLAIFVAILAVVTYGFIKLIFGQLSSDVSLVFQLAVLFWAVFNGFVLFLGIREVLSRRYDRKNYRFRVSQPAEIVDIASNQILAEVQLTDLSLQGAGMIVRNGSALPDDDLLLHLHTPADKCIYLRLDHIFRRKAMFGDTQKIGVTFIPPQSHYRGRLFEYLFVALPGQNSMYNEERQTDFIPAFVETPVDRELAAPKNFFGMAVVENRSPQADWRLRH
jgi:cellulose synthase (UDP-forming)